MRPIIVGLFLAGFSLPSTAGVIFFDNSLQFNLATAGMNAMSTEGWENGANTPGLISFDDPIQPGVANGPFVSGSAAGIRVQSNTLGAAATTTSPTGAFGLVYGIAGSLGVSGNAQPSKQVSSNFPGNSFDIILTPVNGNTPLAIDLTPTFYRVAGASNSATLTITVYNTNNTLLGSITVDNVVDALETAYLGIAATGADSLGRINIWANVNDVTGADSLRVFGTNTSTPEPSTILMSAAGLAGLFLLKRRATK